MITVEDVNDIIRERTEYGMREVETPANGYVLRWSNSAMKWFPSGWHGYVKRGKILKLDANEIFVPASSSAINEMLPYLDPLPLYSGSLEFGKRLALNRKKKSTKSKSKRKAIKKVKSKRK